MKVAPFAAHIEPPPAVRVFLPDRPPDFVIHADRDPPYLRRWHLVGGDAWEKAHRRAAPLHVFLHQILRDDDDRALHDHPWDNLTIVLAGRLRDVSALGPVDLAAGETLFREAAWPHRLEVECFGEPAWSLFVAGPKVREWGFHCPGTPAGAGCWRHWRDYVDQRDSGKVGKGCAP